MKKLLYLLPVLVIFFASCGPALDPPVQIGPGIDTVFYSTCEYQAPVTSPRFDCKGNKLPNPKVVAWETKKCVTVNHIGFNETYLNNLGYQYVGKPVSPVNPSIHPKPLVSNSWRDYFEPMWFFFWLLLIFFAVLLWKFLNWFKTLVVAPAERVASPAPAQTSSTMKEKSEAMANLVKTMKENSVVTGEVNLGEGVTGKFTFSSANKDKPVNKKPEDKKQ